MVAGFQLLGLVFGRRGDPIAGFCLLLCCWISVAGFSIWSTGSSIGWSAGNLEPDARGRLEVEATVLPA